MLPLDAVGLPAVASKLRKSGVGVGHVPGRARTAAKAEVVHSAHGRRPR